MTMVMMAIATVVGPFLTLLLALILVLVLPLFVRVRDLNTGFVGIGIRGTTR